MWWSRRQQQSPGEELTIKARLRKGETLEITFGDHREAHHLLVQGRGEVQLRIPSKLNVTAELVRTTAAHEEPDTDSPPLRSSPKSVA